MFYLKMGNYMVDTTNPIDRTVSASDLTAEAGAPVQLVPDMDQALADLRELKTLSVRFGSNSFACWRALRRASRHSLLSEVRDAPAGTENGVAYFKLTEQFYRALIGTSGMEQ